MKTPVITVLLFLMAHTIAPIEIRSETIQPSALVPLDEYPSETAEKYGLVIAVRDWPFVDSSSECIITISGPYSKRMKAPILDISEISTNIAKPSYALNATLHWEPDGDKIRLRIIMTHRAGFQEVIILPFAEVAAEEGPIKGIKIDLGKILSEHRK